MRYLLLLFLLPLLIGPLYAEQAADTYLDICRTDGSLVVVLHKSIDGKAPVIDGNKWSVELPYDMLTGGLPNSGLTSTINGASACSTMAVKSALDGSSYNGGVAQPGDVNTFATMAAGSAGPKCWCRLTGPITSYWTYIYDYGDNEACAKGCPSYCANGFATNSNTPAMEGGRSVRSALIDGVW